MSKVSASSRRFLLWHFLYSIYLLPVLVVELQVVVTELRTVSFSSL